MKKHIFPLLIIGLTIWSVGCKTDFDLNAPYKSIPAVYGVLDASADTQFIKINKSFLGTGNNASYAKILDSNYYQNLSGTVDEYYSGSLTNSYTLHEMYVGNIDNGIFNEDSQKVYYFIPPSGLNEDATYKLNVNVDELSDPITAETELVKGSGLIFKNNLPGIVSAQGFKFADVQSNTSGNYFDVTPTWSYVDRGKIYELYLKFNFTEYTNTDTTDKYLLWNLGSQVAATTSNAQTFFKTINGESFYNMIKSKLTGYENEANVLKRKPRNIHLILYVGSDDLNTYIEVNEPTTGVVTDKPTYTNIDNGVGIFASRDSYTLSGPLELHTTYTLCKGSITSGFKFCSDSSNYLITHPDMSCN